MSATQSIIKEIEHESVATTKMLERVPADKFDWAPHQKSMSLKQLASHIADLPKTVTIISTTDYLDFAEKKTPKASISSAEDLVAIFKKNITDSISALKTLKEEDLSKLWAMRSGDQVFLNAPKKVSIRTVALNHLYHHRGQLSVYLRLLNIPLPSVYGPSADEQ